MRNLRGLTILAVLAFHSVLSYVQFAKAPTLPFGQPPFEWRAIPIVDSQRCFGFDLFAAWEDVYLMALMFFLSGLFVWPSLVRKGRRKYLADRLLRLGAPFAFGVLVVMPLALYPVYRVSAIDPGLMDYGRSYFALPFVPNGPMWFLWVLMVLTVALAGLHRFVPSAVASLGLLASHAAAKPCRWFVGVAAAAALAYVPLALAFTPWSWSDSGPLALQLSRPLLYSVFYVAGSAVGARGLDVGLLAREGMLARRWSLWLLCAASSLLLWMGLAGLTLSYGASAPPLALQFAADASFALASAGSVFFIMAACVRFGSVRSRFLEGLSKNAFGIYLLHYAPLVWLQYALLDVSLSAFAKASIVTGGTLLVALAGTVFIRTGRFGSRLIGEEPLASADAPAQVITPAR